MKNFVHNFQARNVKVPPVGSLPRPHLMYDEADIQKTIDMASQAFAQIADTRF